MFTGSDDALKLSQMFDLSEKNGGSVMMAFTYSREVFWKILIDRSLEMSQEDEIL